MQMFPKKRSSRGSLGHEQMKLILKIQSGIADRVRGMLWALEMAEQTGRSLEVIWERTSECGANFTDLFQPIAIPVHDADVYPEHRLLDMSFFSDEVCRKLLLSCDENLKLNFVAERRDFFGFADTFKPSDYVAACVRNFGMRLDRDCVGVHIRRGDKEGHLEFPATQAYFDIIPRNNQVFLATESIGVLGEFSSYYENRLRWYPVRSLDRHSREATIDSVVILYILRGLKYFVSSEYSGYSAMVHGGFRVDDPSKRLKFYILRRVSAW